MYGVKKEDGPIEDAGGGWKPVLGISDEPGGAAESAESKDWRSWMATSLPGTVFDQPEPEQLIELTVIVPARNEEASIGACLESLVKQSEDTFELGRDWDLVVVDDSSTDRTAEIARGFAGVTVMPADKLERGCLIRRSALPRPMDSFCLSSARRTAGWADTRAWPAMCWKMWR
jgi:hypothetical protein